MKLLLDQNLSPRLLHLLPAAFEGSVHVREQGLSSASDDAVWTFAAEHEFTIVTKESDFHQRSFLYGAPPKVVWLRVGNCTTDQALEVLVRHSERLLEFERDELASFLVLDSR